MARKKVEPKRKTMGFGVPVPENNYHPHYFIVQIPDGRIKRPDVTIIEDMGEREATMIKRVVIPRPYWDEVSGAVSRDFNLRLKQNNVNNGKWQKGDTPVYNLLGKELCVLAWAIEDANPDQVGVALRNWLAFRPDERWWLFGVTAASAGEAEQKGLGWRKALKAALAETPLSQRTSITRGNARETLTTGGDTKKKADQCDLFINPQKN